MECLILIAADSIESLRCADIFRVLEQNDANVRSELAAYISAERPEFANEVAEIMDEEFSG